MPSIIYGLSTISFEVRRAERKTLAIHVYPDGGVLVDAPLQATMPEIEAKVRKRAPWIRKQQRLFASYPPAIPQREYVSGESFRYLGRQYRLRIIRGRERSAKLRGGFLVLVLKQRDSTKTAKHLMDSWLRGKAERVFMELLARCAEHAAAIGIETAPPLRLVRMQKRWGSCTKEGVILLNPELVAAPKDCIEYVIFHELCHLRARNHSPHFYGLLARLLSNWEVLRLKLNQTVELRLEY